MYHHQQRTIARVQIHQKITSTQEGEQPPAASGGCYGDGAGGDGDGGGVVGALYYLPIIATPIYIYDHPLY